MRRHFMTCRKFFFLIKMMQYLDNKWPSTAVEDGAAIKKHLPTPWGAGPDHHPGFSRKPTGTIGQNYKKKKDP